MPETGQHQPNTSVFLPVHHDEAQSTARHSERSAAMSDHRTLVTVWHRECCMTGTQTSKRMLTVPPPEKCGAALVP